MQTSATCWNAFRPLRKCQNAPLKVSEASEGASGTPAKFARYQENFAGGRSRPEGSEGASGTLAKIAGYQENFAGGRSRPRGRKGPKSLLTFP